MRAAPQPWVTVGSQGRRPRGTRSTATALSRGRNQPLRRVVAIPGRAHAARRQLAEARHQTVQAIAVAKFANDPPVRQGVRDALERAVGAIDVPRDDPVGQAPGDGAVRRVVAVEYGAHGRLDLLGTAAEVVGVADREVGADGDRSHPAKRVVAVGDGRGAVTPNRGEPVGPVIDKAHGAGAVDHSLAPAALVEYLRHLAATRQFPGHRAQAAARILRVADSGSLAGRIGYRCGAALLVIPELPPDPGRRRGRGTSRRREYRNGRCR